MEAILETERLKLRPPQPQDAYEIATQLGDWDVASMLARVPYPYTLADAESWLFKNATREFQAANKTFAVETKTGLIGNISLSNICTIEDGKIAELGYWFGKDHWFKGYATEAAQALITHAFDDLGFAGLRAGHFKENPRSGRVLTKVGFRYAGENKQFSLARKDTIAHVDVILTKAQWQEFNEAQAA